MVFDGNYKGHTLSKEASLSFQAGFFVLTD
jgi:hypothetical protein